MKEVEIKVASRSYRVTCADGEEAAVTIAGEHLNQEAEAIRAQFGSVPENRTLLLTGLMMADKTLELKKEIDDLKARLSNQQDVQVAEKNTPDLEQDRKDKKALLDVLTRIAEESETLADTIN